MTMSRDRDPSSQLGDPSGLFSKSDFYSLLRVGWGVPAPALPVRVKWMQLSGCIAGSDADGASATDNGRGRGNPILTRASEARGEAVNADGRIWDR